MLVCFVSAGSVMAADSWTTNKGTKIEISLSYEDEWDLDSNNDVKITFKVNSFGEDVRDVHDIQLSVKVQFPDKTYSDSAGTWTIDSAGESKTYTFGFYVKASEVDRGDSGSVYYKAVFKEDVALQTDPESDTGWKSYGDVEIPSGEPATSPPDDGDGGTTDGFAKIQISDIDCPNRVNEKEGFTLRVTLENVGTIDATVVSIAVDYDRTYLTCSDVDERNIGTIKAGLSETVTWAFTADNLGIGSSGESVKIEIEYDSANAGSGDTSTVVNIEPSGFCLGTILIVVIPLIVALPFMKKLKP